MKISKKFVTHNIMFTWLYPTVFDGDMVLACRSGYTERELSAFYQLAVWGKRKEGV